METGVIEVRRPALRGAPPITITGGPLKPTGGARPFWSSRPERILGFTDLKPLHLDVLELIRITPRNVREVAESLNLGEWSKARWALDGLVNRSLAVEVHGYPTTWRALR